MEKTLKQEPHFKPRSKPAHDGLVVIYDLSDFTRFFTQPDAHRYVPRFLNRVAEAISAIANGGTNYWDNDSPTQLSRLDLQLEHRKFLGDGELLIWQLDEDSDGKLAFALNRLWNLQNKFARFCTFAQQDIPVAALPPSIKFGIARGDIYELESTNAKRESEFIGVSINLASRLVKYCPELSWLASARIELSKEAIEKHKYISVVATAVRGYPDEIVIVDKGEYNRLTPEVRERLFRSLK